MALRFTITDYTFNPIGSSTIVDEPVGWDGIFMKLKRDKTWHGFFDYFDDTLGATALQWDGDAGDILRTAYEYAGTEANVVLLLEYQCDDTDVYEEFYTGRFNFSASYKDICGDRCYVECTIGTTSCAMLFRNRYDQKVDIESLRSFDASSDDLTAYDNIAKEVTLPGKPLQFDIDWQTAEGYSIAYTDDLLNAEFIGTVGTFFFNFEWGVQTLSEIMDFNAAEFVWGIVNPSAPDSAGAQERLIYNGIVDLRDESGLLCSSDFDIQIDIEGDFTIETADTIQFDGTFSLVYGNDADGYASTNLQTGLGCAGCSGTTTTAISISSAVSITLNPGDRLYLQFVMANFQYTTGGGGAPSDPFNVTIAIDSAHLTILTVSRCANSVAKLSLINEVISRVTEATTGDCMRVYSDYFGRTDAQPYASDVDGCGGLEAVTDGLAIRNALLKDGSEPHLRLSAKDCFEALNAIHNIGIGREPDPNRADHELLRWEPKTYFYNETVILTCDNVNEVTKEVLQEAQVSAIKVGYADWETENTNGLNDVFGQREYRTPLATVRNTFTQISNFIASDYAIEVTRRKYGTNTKDWKFDNKTFIVCLGGKYYGSMIFASPHAIGLGGIDLSAQISIGDTITISDTVSNNGTYTVTNVVFDGYYTSIVVAESITTEIVSGSIVNNTTTLRTVETGNVASSSNVDFADEAYNLRITPVRNLLRHLHTILQSCRNYAAALVSFTAGTGNFAAEIELDADSCVNEAGVLSESEIVEAGTFGTPSDTYPLHYNELVKFTYPLNYFDWKELMANPYGLIAYGCTGGDVLYGWIDDIKYSPFKGTAEFTLKPKIVI